MNHIRGLGKWFWGWLGFALAVFGAVPAFLWFRSITVRDWVFLAAIFVLALAVIYIFLYIRHNEKKAEGLAKAAEAPKPTKEILFVLGKLAGNALGFQNKGALSVLYDQEFKGREVDEYTAVIGTLRGYMLIKHDDKYPSEEDIYLSDKGSAYYLDHKERPKKK